jgi:hypothetical protein
MGYGSSKKIILYLCKKKINHKNYILDDILKIL